jgi:hypothetical protein
LAKSSIEKEASADRERADFESIETDRLISLPTIALLPHTPPLKYGKYPFIKSSNRDQYRNRRAVLTGGMGLASRVDLTASRLFSVADEGH